MQSEIPWASIIVRKVFGVAGAAHFAPMDMFYPGLAQRQEHYL